MRRPSPAKARAVAFGPIRRRSRLVVVDHANKRRVLMGMQRSLLLLAATLLEVQARLAECARG